jgi:hypothetical protein
MLTGDEGSTNVHLKASHTCWCAQVGIRGTADGSTSTMAGGGGSPVVRRPPPRNASSPEERFSFLVTRRRGLGGSWGKGEARRAWSRASRHGGDGEVSGAMVFIENEGMIGSDIM